MSTEQATSSQTPRVLTLEHLDRIEAFLSATLGARSFPTFHGIEGWEWKALLAAARKGLSVLVLTLLIPLPVSAQGWDRHSPYDRGYRLPEYGREYPRERERGVEMLLFEMQRQERRRQENDRANQIIDRWYDEQERSNRAQRWD